LNWVSIEIYYLLLNLFRGTWLGIALTTGNMFVCFGFKEKTMLSPTAGG